MIDSSLNAPNQYNIVNEIEQFAQDEKRNALIIVDEYQQVTYISYKQLIQLANRYANVFEKVGLKKGDNVLIMLPKSLEVYAAYIAALKVGIHIMPCSDQLRAKDINYRIQHGNAKGFIYHIEYLEEINQIEQDLILLDIGSNKKSNTNLDFLAEDANETFRTTDTLANDIAFIAYTSGTTGTPKGVIHQHSWGYVHLKTVVKDWLNVRNGDIVWATAAPGWQKWIWTPFLATLGSGATAFVYKGKFVAETYLQLISSYHINVLCCTPTEYRMMMKSDEFPNAQLSSVRSAVSAGEPLNGEVIERFKVHDVQVRDGYGQTENTLLIGTLHHMETRLGAMGKPTPGNKVEIIDSLGEIVPIGQIGDIAVHKDSPALFKGYYNEPERTLMQFRGDWYMTGDRARKDEEGYFWFEGRADDMIISAGYTIGPFDIEDALLKHPLVQECAVVASPDEVRGSVVKAFVVLKDFEETKKEGIVEELQNHVKTVVAPYSYPRKIEFLEELPKTMSGKIRRGELRKREQNKLV